MPHVVARRACALQRALLLAALPLALAATASAQSPAAPPVGATASVDSVRVRLSPTLLLHGRVGATRGDTLTVRSVELGSATPLHVERASVVELDRWAPHRAGLAKPVGIGALIGALGFATWAIVDNNRQSNFLHFPDAEIGAAAGILGALGGAVAGGVVGLLVPRTEEWSPLRTDARVLRIEPER